MAISNGTTTDEGSSPRRLKVVVCGGGIAGFATALLLREDHDVTVLESSTLNNELGAAVTFSMNATRLMRSSLERAGFSAEKARAVEAEKLQELDYETLEVKVDVSMAQVTGKYGQPWWYFSRSDVHGELKRAALSEFGLGPPAKLELGARVERVDHNTGTIYLEGGQTVEADVIVGADGIRTATGNSVFGKLTSLSQGLYAYRCMIETEKLRQDPETASLVDEAKILMLSSADKRIVAYPCSSWDWINIVAIYPDDRDRGLDWKTGVTVDEMINTFSDFNPKIQKMMSMAANTGVWQLRDRDPMETLVKGKFALIGDASHAMGPHQGQGACQAIEDAEALRIVLKGAKPDEVEARLQVFDELRAERVRTVLQYSRDMAPKRAADGGKANTGSSMHYSHYYWSHMLTKDGVELMNKHGYPIDLVNESTAELACRS